MQLPPKQTGSPCALLCGPDTPAGEVRARARHAAHHDTTAGWSSDRRFTEPARCDSGANKPPVAGDLAPIRQRLIEIALALAMRPKVLLLDEPAAGVPTGESRELFETIAQLPREVTIVLIEHDMDLVFRFAERISVLVSGAILVEDAPDRIAANPRVKEVYLGESHG